MLSFHTRTLLFDGLLRHSAAVSARRNSFLQLFAARTLLVFCCVKKLTLHNARHEGYCTNCLFAFLRRETFAFSAPFLLFLATFWRRGSLMSNAQPLGCDNIANASPPGLTTWANAPRGGGHSWNWLMHNFTLLNWVCQFTLCIWQCLERQITYWICGIYHK